MSCPVCGHLLDEHSSEPEIGCLHVTYVLPVSPADLGGTGICPCLRTGTSAADQ